MTRIHVTIDGIPSCEAYHDHALEGDLPLFCGFDCVRDAQIAMRLLEELYPARVIEMVDGECPTYRREENAYVESFYDQAE